MSSCHLSIFLILETFLFPTLQFKVKGNYSSPDYDPLCDSPEKLPIPAAIHWGKFDLFAPVIHRIKSNGNSTFLMLGGSITADGRFYTQFYTDILQKHKVQVVNRGHGSTDPLYALYCIQVEDICPDIVFLEYKINDYRRFPEEMESLIRKLLQLPSHPLVVILNFALLKADCSKPVTYLPHAVYYGLPLIDLCSHLHYCFHKNTTQRLYSMDGGHPRGPKGHIIPSGVLAKWWNTTLSIVELLGNDSTSLFGTGSGGDGESRRLPERLFPDATNDNHRFCECLNDDSPQDLVPMSTSGFRNVSRTKFGERGFSNVKRAWEANSVGDTITFRFTGSNLMVAVYQNMSGMGVADVFLDGESSPSRSISGFFPGYPWRRYGGRQEIVTLYERLQDAPHTVTFAVNPLPSNLHQPGHNFQIIALMYSSSLLVSGGAREIR